MVASCAYLPDVQFFWKFHEGWLEDLLKLTISTFTVLATAPGIELLVLGQGKSMVAASTDL